MDTIKTAELETLARLARKARKEGVQLYRDRRDGRHYASSGTTPGKRYYVTLASCTCVGFQTHQRCKHWAALNVALILQEGGPDPETIAAPAPRRCESCQGLGSHPGTLITGPGTWIYTIVTCERCSGAGHQVAA